MSGTTLDRQRSARPPRQDDDRHAEGDILRGMLFGLLLSIPIWLALGLLVAAVL